MVKYDVMIIAQGSQMKIVMVRYFFEVLKGISVWLNLMKFFIVVVVVFVVVNIIITGSVF